MIWYNFRQWEVDGMKRLTILLVLLFGVGLAGCTGVHGTASAGGGQGGNTQGGAGGQFLLGSGIRF